MKITNYREYLLRQTGIKESHINPSDIDPNEYPGIDPDELVTGANDESEEHGFPIDKSIETAIDHLKKPDQAHYYKGMKKARDQGMLKDIMLSPILSPTAISTPVIGVSIRGSNTGGLPSGADQVGDISPEKLGGYEKIPIDKANSKLVGKTPTNPQINSASPITDNPQTVDAITHPFQVQKDAGEEPQAVTGASTDSDSTLKLKSAMPKGIDVDVSENDNNDGRQQRCAKCGEMKPSDTHGYVDKWECPECRNKTSDRSVNETFARHKELMNAKLKIKESTCKCGNPDCTCGCKSDTTNECKPCGCGKLNTTHDMKENAGAKEPFINKFKMNPEKAGLVKISEAFDRLGVLAGVTSLKTEKSHGKLDNAEKKNINEKYSVPFERMRGLANLGERRVMSNGLWGNVNEDSQLEPYDIETDQFAPGPRDRTEPSQPITKKRIQDPTREGMMKYLKSQFGKEDGFEDSAEVAIYWFANFNHGGQGSNLYSVLSTSPFSPGPISRGPEKGSTEEMMYQSLEQEFGSGTLTNEEKSSLNEIKLNAIMEILSKKTSLTEKEKKLQGLAAKLKNLKDGKAAEKAKQDNKTNLDKLDKEIRRDDLA